MIGIIYEFLRDPRLQHEMGIFYPRLYQVLLQLGDERGAQILSEKLRIDQEFRRSDIPGAEIAQAVERSGQPAVIPYLAPLLFINESPESDIRVPDDIPTGDKISFQAGDIIQKAIGASGAIPLEVKEWSRGLRTLEVPRGDYREMLREWWKANEEAFRRKDYAAVRPGRDLSAMAATEPAPFEPARHPAQITPTAAASPTKTPALVASISSETQPLWPFVAGTAIAVATLAGLLFHWKWRG